MKENNSENRILEIPKLILIEDLGTMFTTESSKKKARFGIYKCGFCGEEFRTVIYDVKRGNTKSCGCYKKHGLKNTRLYTIWTGIKSRTLNPNYKNYVDYGGRGITICEDWLDIRNFYDWAMTNGYSDKLSIDRIDNEGNYCPENCRWTTKTIQRRNTRIPKNNTSGYKGVCYTKKDNKYVAYIRVNRKRIYLGYFQTAVEGAIAYNNYIIENNLEGFNLNEIPKEII